MKLCVYQGTFNPIHNAHIQAATFALNTVGFDKILFIPAAKPPHKEFDPDMSLHRLNMVKLAAEKNPDFEVSDIEYNLNGKSYTYNTICELYKKYNPEEKINFIIGTDAFKKIESWYKTDELKKLIDFIVFIRENNFTESSLEHLNKKGYRFKIMPHKFLDISSTEIRNRIKLNQSTEGMLDPKVKDYIKQYGLYKG